MIPVDNWQDLYPPFVDQVYQVFDPDQWTIGSLRYFPALPMWTKKVGRDTSIYGYAQERSHEDGRRRVSITVRAEMYRTAMDAILRSDPHAVIRLCKETEGLYAQLGLTPRGCCYSEAMNGAKA